MTIKRLPTYDGLNLDTLRAANVARLPLFKNAKGEPAHSKPDGSDWSNPEWCNAVLGELGELANLLKKVQRGDMTMDAARPAIADELADVQTYLDLLAFRCGVDLATATIEKFNRVSRRVGAPVHIINAHAWEQSQPVPLVPLIAAPQITNGYAPVIRTCPYTGCPAPYTNKPPCALCYE